MNNNGAPQIISFLSGKGGAGKTSIATSVSTLLNDIGFSVLLIDLDFATNGASYFYKHLFYNNRNTIGIYELINTKDLVLSEITTNSFSHSFVSIKENLYFLPAKVNFSKKVPLHNSIIENEFELNEYLNLIIKSSGYRHNFDFILIDNQAGSNLTSKVAASISDKVVIVSELDPISSDAVDNLLIQIGDAFPDYRRHLINKLDISESQNYKNLSNLFQSMNRLPPLPFDFDVRSAFANRRVPINIEEPNTFTIALFNSIKAFLPEFSEQIDAFGQVLLNKFSKYQDHVDNLIERKNSLELQLSLIIKMKERKNRRRILMLSVSFIYLGIFLIASSFFDFKLFNSQYSYLTVIGIMIILVSIIFSFVYLTQSKEKLSEQDEKGKIDNELLEINKEINMYKSLMLTRSKEFLLFFESQPYAVNNK